MSIGDAIQIISGTAAGQEINIFGDNTYIYVVNSGYESNSFGIKSYSYDGAGNLTYITTYNADSAQYYYGAYSGGYLFVGGNNGITTFTVSGGTLSKQSIWNSSATTHYKIKTDGNYLYSPTSTLGMMAFTWNGGTGAVSFYGNSDQGYLLFDTSIQQYNFIYSLRSDYIPKHRIATSDVNYITEQNYVNVERTLIWENRPDILIITHKED